MVMVTRFVFPASRVFSGWASCLNFEVCSPGRQGSMGSLPFQFSRLRVVCTVFTSVTYNAQQFFVL